MNALKARGVTCDSEEAVQLDGATSAIDCVTHSPHFIAAAIYPTQAVADDQYRTQMDDNQAVNGLKLGLVFYYALGDRWMVDGDDAAAVQLAAHAFNGKYHEARL